MRTRILVAFLFLTVLVLVVLEVPFGFNAADHQRDELETDVLTDAFAVASFSQATLLRLAEDPSADPRSEDPRLQQLAMEYAERTGGRLVVVDAEGIEVADSANPGGEARSFAQRPEVVAALDGETAIGTRRSEDLGESLLYVAVPVAAEGEVLGVVRVTYPTSELDERVQRIWLALAAVGVVSLAGAALAGHVIARSVSRPISQLQATAARFGQGDLDARAPADAGPREVRDLAAAFNDTAARLQRLLRAQEQFVADASHQLRTPITALRLRLENLEDELADGGHPAEVQEDVRAAIAEVARMSRMVDGLLALARAERTSGAATAEALVVDAVLAERVEAWQPMAADTGVTIAALPAPGVTVLATRDHLTQSIDNLVANALDASPAGATVTLSATARGERVEVHVTDHGSGLTDEERDHAFDRFWRAETTRGAFGGSGLGLSIVQKLTEADQGTVRLDATPGGGVDAVLDLRPAPGRALG